MFTLTAQPRSPHGCPRTLFFVLILLAVGSAAAAFSPSGLLEIHYINVQQGGSTLVIGPNGTTVLMDAGNNGKGSSEIVPYLMSLGLEPADGLDITLAAHLDADHIGGFDEVVAAGYDVAVRNWYNGSTKTGTRITEYKNAATLTTAGAPVAIPLGQVVDIGNGATIVVVAVNGEVLGHGPVAGASDENDLSVAVLIQYRHFDFLWGSDLGGGDDDAACTGRSTGQVNLETPLAHQITPGGSWPFLTSAGVEVLHVNHHGSESSTNSDWMNLLRPQMAVISVGSNGFGHPRSNVVDNVLRSQAPCVTAPPALVLQTEEGDLGDPETSLSGFAVGDVVITTDGQTYQIDATGAVTQGPDERVAAGLPVILRVEEIFLDGFESGDTTSWTVTGG